jgi:hypothetical protein
MFSDLLKHYRDDLTRTDDSLHPMQVSLNFDLLKQIISYYRERGIVTHFSVS